MNKRPTSSRAPAKPKAAATRRTLGFPYLTAAEMERRSAEGCARFLRLSPAKQRQRLIELEILNPDGTLNRPKMDHVPYGPQD
ncbi:MAG: hypothetical protein ACKVY0_19320 [Prosthecobacter sp.]|uniref:hypothetical protein n=1 Tax=Prosthecobacter sp. TaxID=1965333 RepID=UPI003903B20A